MASSTTNNGSSTFDASSLVNGLFTDFAPLLALFGDEVTKQFLATSMGWGDDILLALAPIGIMNVLVSAIRVSGYPLMKSIIGRARDSPDDEEKDILSSTSNNVREIWNGQRVVRQGGTSQTTEIVYSVRDNIKEKPLNPGIWTLQSALAKNGASSPIYRIKPYRTWVAPWKRTEDSRDIERSRTVMDHIEDAEDFPKSLEGRSPNLTLNIKAAIPSQLQLWTITLAGAVVQATVFIFNALAVYFYRWPRAGYVVAPYGFPLWAVGTTCITTGMCLCARVVEYCTTESVAEPLSDQSKTQIAALPDGNGKETPQSIPRDVNDSCENNNGDTGFRIVRLQSSMPAVNLPAYAIFNDDTNPRILMSRRTIFPPGSTTSDSQKVESDPEKKDTRQDERSEFMATMTTIGTFFTLAGFICQNLGIRQLHWSAGVAQLVSTLLLVLLRAWLRRRVGDAPAHRLQSTKEFEATQLAAHIHGVDRLMMVVGEHHSECHTPDHMPCDKCRMSEKPFPLLFFTPFILNPGSNDNLDGSIEPGSATEALTMAYRVFESQNYLEKTQPGSSTVDQIAEKTYDVMAALLQVLGREELSWSQEVFFEGTQRSKSSNSTDSSADNLRGILGLKHMIVEKISSNYSSRKRQLRLGELRALLSTTMYFYSRMQDGSHPDHANFLFIVGHSTSNRELDKKQFIYEGISTALGRGRSHDPVISSIWSRSTDGKPGQFPINITGLYFNKTVFGMSNAGFKYNKNGSLIIISERVIVVSDRSILEMFALDLISNFLKQLIAKEIETTSFRALESKFQGTGTLAKKIHETLANSGFVDGFGTKGISAALVIIVLAFTQKLAYDSLDPWWGE